MPAVAASSPCQSLRRRLPHLPEKLRAAGRYVAQHEFDAATRSMRDLAASAGLQPATFTRLAQALGHPGWNAFRESLIAAQRDASPFSDRVRRRGEGGSVERLAQDMMGADLDAVRGAASQPVVAAARMLAAAPRIWVAGFRSCRSVATLFHYQMRLFRPDDIRLVGGMGPEDCDFGAFRRDDAILIVGFEPYSRPSVLTAQAARLAGCRIVVIADHADAPIARGADHSLLFESARSPGFFPSLAAAVTLAQTLAGVIFELGGEANARRLRETEARLAALSQYVGKPSNPGRTS